MAGKENRRQRKISEFSNSKHSGGSGGGTTMVDRAGDGETHRSGDTPAADISLELKNIMKELTSFRSEITTKTDRVEIKMDLFQARFTAMDTRMLEMESRISSLEDRLPLTESSAAASKSALKLISERQEDAENRSRRNNVRIIGLREGCESSPNTSFFEAFLKEVLPDAQFTSFFSVVRAHRSLGPRPPPGAPARAVLVRFLHYRDRDVALSAARQAGAIHYQGARIHFFQDLSVSVQRARKKYDTAKEMLRERSIQYAMLFPAKLKILVNGKAHFFLDASTACSFIEKLPPARVGRRSDGNHVNGDNNGQSDPRQVEEANN